MNLILFVIVVAIAVFLLLDTPFGKKIVEYINHLNHLYFPSRPQSQAQELNFLAGFDNYPLNPEEVGLFKDYLINITKPQPQPQADAPQSEEHKED